MDIMRLGIVGCGQIASWHGRAAAATKAVELVACCDQRHGLAEQYAKEYGCERSYAELDEMLAGGQELDAVLLATWPMNHRDAIIKCLDQGIRLILCEKSLTCDPEDAYEVWEAAARTGAKIVEGLMWRHHPAIQTVDGLIASGRLGKLDYIRAQFDFFVPEEAAADDPTRNWRHQAELGGGVPWDGILIMAWLRRLEEAKDIPVVVITGTNAAKERTRALEAGAVGFFQKPINPDQLMTMIRSVLNRKPGEPSASEATGEPAVREAARN